MAVCMVLAASRWEKPKKAIVTFSSVSQFQITNKIIPHSLWHVSMCARKNILCSSSTLNVAEFVLRKKKIASLLVETL